MSYRKTETLEILFELYFCGFFKILFEIIVVIIVITFNKHAEIHLNAKKYQIYSKICEIPT